MDADWLFVPEDRGDVSGHPEIRVLVDSLRDKAVDVGSLAEDMGECVAKRWDCLDGWVGHVTNIHIGCQSKYPLHLVISDLLLCLHNVGVHLPHIGQIAENERQIVVEPTGDDVLGIFLSPIRIGLQRDLVLFAGDLVVEEFFILGELDDNRDLEYLLEPFCEEEWE